MCGGGCPKDRFAKSRDGEDGQYYLCEGLKAFFDYAVPRLEELVALQRQRKSVGEIAAALRELENARWKGVGRNDPCICGSGRKAKKCCWDRRP